MDAKKFVELTNASFFTGVPDSRLKGLCDYLISEVGVGKNHFICANEGNAAAMAAGYHLSTGKIPLVYLQNSGLGNIINPVASLLNDKVYAIPCIFVVGWRGEPGVHDEPQHIFQGAVTEKLLADMEIKTFIITKETTEEEIKRAIEESAEILAAGKQIAFLAKEGALTYAANKYSNENKMRREEIIGEIVKYSADDAIVSTTGKASRELFELREKAGTGHANDFLTVGSMGHASSIALGIAINKPNKKIWCIDGDGALLMHLGALTLVGTSGVKNFIHVVINNSAHESVGGQPTVAGSVDLCAFAKAAGYEYVKSVADIAELDKALEDAKNGNKLAFIEAKSAIGARKDLGRPTTTPEENKAAFMAMLKE